MRDATFGTHVSRQVTPASDGKQRQQQHACHDRLTYAPGKELAARAYGDCPPGLLRCLGRLGAQPPSSSTYRAPVRVPPRGGPCAKALVHSTEIGDELIHAFATLPAGMASKRTI